MIPKEIRRTMRIREGDPLEIYTDTDGQVIFKKYSPMGELSEFAAPILSEGDVLGCVLFVAAHGDGPAGETERKLAQAVSGFLGKQMES